MKKILSVICTALSVICFAQGIQFEDLTYAQAIEKARKENKIIFIDAYTSWCGPCKLMEKNVFPDEKLGVYFNKNFINVHYDMEKGEGRDIARKFSVFSYPSLLFLNAQGELIQKFVGYRDAEELKGIGEMINLPGQQQSLSEKYKNGDRSPEVLQNLFKLSFQTDRGLAKKIAGEYFQQWKGSQLSQDEILMILLGTETSGDPTYKIFTSKKEDITKMLSEKEYESFDMNYQLNKILDENTDAAKHQIDEAKFLAAAVKITSKAEAEDFLNHYRMNYYLSEKMYPEYATAAIKVYGDGASANAKDLARAAYIFSENIKNKEMLNSAVIWAEKAMQQDESAANAYNLAKLYLLTGKNDAAKMYADQAVYLAEQNHMDPTPAKELLKKIK